MRYRYGGARKRVQSSGFTGSTLQGNNPSRESLSRHDRRALASLPRRAARSAAARNSAVRSPRSAPLAARLDASTMVKTHRTHRDVDDATQARIDAIKTTPTLHAPPVPRRPALSSQMSAQQKLHAQQSTALFLSSLSVVRRVFSSISPVETI